MASRDIFIIIFILTIVSYIAIRRYYRINTLAFFYGLLGILVGIFFGALLVLPFDYFFNPYIKWMPWVISYVTPLLFLERFFQGEKITKFVKRNIASRLSGLRVFKRYITPILIDQETLGNQKFLKMVEAGFIWGHIMIPKQSLDQLKKDLQGSNRAKKMTAAKALEAFSVLEQTPRIIVEKVVLRSDLSLYDSLLETVYSRGGKIYSFDDNLIRAAKKAGCDVADLNKIIK